MQKFGFKIQTRGGLNVDNLVIQASDSTAAEARLKQMYIGCTVLESKVLEEAPARGDGSDFESLIGLIASHPDRVA